MIAIRANTVGLSSGISAVNTGLRRASGPAWVPDPNRWMFGGTRLGLNNSTHNGTFVAGTGAPTTFITAGFESQASKVKIALPAYPVTHLRFVFCNWRRSISGNTPIEVTPGHALTINDFFVHIAGTAFQVQFSGSGTGTIPDGESFITDALDITSLSAAQRTGALADLCTLSTVPLGGTRMCQGVDRVMHLLGEGIQHAATPAALAGLCAANTITGQGASGNVFPLAPVAVLCRGWDGRPTVLITGDSIFWGQNYSSSNTYFGHDARFSRGMAAVALDSTTGPGRLPYANFAVPGVNSTQSDALADHPRTFGVIDAARALNAGNALPFTCFFGNMGTNDFGSAVQATIYPTPFLTNLDAHINAWRTRYPGPKWIHTTLWPRTNTNPAQGAPGPNGAWGSTAAQMPVNTDATTGNGRWLFNAALVAGTTGLNIDGVINTAPVVQDATFPDRWKTGPRSGTFSASYASASLTFQSATAFEVGDSVSVDNAGTIINRIVTARTGSGPFTHTLTTSFGANLAAGTAIVTRLTDDGVHPWVTGHLACAEVIDANKHLFT